MDNTQFREILEAVEEGVYVVDRNRLLTYWNRGAEQLTGYSRGEVEGHFCFDNILDHVDETGKNLCRSGCPLAATISDGRSRSIEVYLRHRDGHRVPVKVRAFPMRDPSGRVVGAVELFSENGAAVATRARQAELERDALVDPLTELANRRFAESSLLSHLAELKRLGRTFAVLLVDIDRFKGINDAHGHPAGDRALRTIAATLRSAVRNYDFVARWGGEEFLVMAPGVDAPGLSVLAERLRALVERSRLPLDGGRSQSLTVSVGGAPAMRGDDIESLVGRADKALYRSKADGRNRVTIEE